MVTAGITSWTRLHEVEIFIGFFSWLLFFCFVFFFCQWESLSLLHLELKLCSEDRAEGSVKSKVFCQTLALQFRYFTAWWEKKKIPAVPEREPEGSWRGTEAGRLCPGCMLNVSRSKIWSRTMSAASHKVRRCFVGVWSHNLASTASETVFH